MSLSRPYGIDVSHHQAVGSIPWKAIRQTSSFAMCRATYGTKRDRNCVAHCDGAREAGLSVGLYHFFRISQSVHEQLGVFREMAALSGCQPGDIVPALDVELDPLPTITKVSPSWQAAVKTMLDALVAEFGDALVYITQADFGNLGKPEWILERPLWVAHWTQKSTPATPSNKPWAMWQHRVGAYDPEGPGGWHKAKGELDQNRISGSLPRVARVPWRETRDIPMGVKEPEVEEESWESLKARSAALVADNIHDQLSDMSSRYDHDDDA